MARKMPPQKPGKSETIVITPFEFMDAVKRYLKIGWFVYDLAASDDNAQAASWFTKEQNALKQSWSKPYVNVARNGSSPWFWLNPPYDDIRPWVEKCWNESRKGVQIAVLVPAAVGSGWWEDWVHEKARVRFLRSRIYFLNKDHKPIVSKKTGKPTPYPKDLALLIYGGTKSDSVGPKWYEPWAWKPTTQRRQR